MKYKRKDGKEFKTQKFFVCPKCNRRLYIGGQKLVCNNCSYYIDYKEIPTRKELSGMTKLK